MKGMVMKMRIRGRAGLPKAEERLLRMTRERLNGPGVYRLTRRLPWRADDYVVVSPDGTAIVTRFRQKEKDGEIIEIPIVSRYEGYFAHDPRLRREPQ